MPSFYFEARERALLGRDYEDRYTPPGREILARAGIAAHASGFAENRGNWRRPSFGPACMRTIMRVFIMCRSRVHLPLRLFWMFSPATMYSTCAPRPAEKAHSWLRR